MISRAVVAAIILAGAGIANAQQSAIGAFTITFRKS